MKFVLLFVLIISVLCLNGCGKKQEALTESQMPLSVEMLPTGNMTAQPETISPEAQVSIQEVSIPQGPYKPTNQEIQTALKNAGYYAGEIDGKIGPMSKKAIEEFQKASNLKVDGKVGPKTWEALGKYLNPAAQTPAKQ